MALVLWLWKEITSDLSGFIEISAEKKQLKNSLLIMYQCFSEESIHFHQPGELIHHLHRPSYRLQPPCYFLLLWRPNISYNKAQYCLCCKSSTLNPSYILIFHFIPQIWVLLIHMQFYILGILQSVECCQNPTSWQQADVIVYNLVDCCENCFKFSLLQVMM